MPRRWAHTRGVAARARTLVPILGDAADLIEAAAWLHDIGYSPTAPDGLPVCVQNRLSEIARRYGPFDVVTRFITKAKPHLIASVGRVSGAWTLPGRINVMPTIFR